MTAAVTLIKKSPWIRAMAWKDMTIRALATRSSSRRIIKLIWPKKLRCKWPKVIKIKDWYKVSLPYQVMKMAWKRSRSRDLALIRRIRPSQMMGAMIHEINSVRAHSLKARTVHWARAAIQMKVVSITFSQTLSYPTSAEDSEEDVSAASSRKDDD